MQALPSINSTMTQTGISYHGRHISGPHGECVPVDIKQKAGAVLSQAINVPARQRGGHLEKLVRVEEWSHCGVQTNRKSM